MNHYEYCPILSLKAAELLAFKELPKRDKQLILPLIPIKRWLGSKELDKSFQNIDLALDELYWIADIDHDYLNNEKTFLFTGKHPDLPVFESLLELTKPDNGYRNWVNFIKSKPNTIPCLQIGVLSELEAQVKEFQYLGRGLVLRIQPNTIDSQTHKNILTVIAKFFSEKPLVIYDLGKIPVDYEAHFLTITELIREASSIIPACTFSISGSSFPDSFAGESSGSKTIHERRLFNKIKQEFSHLSFIYSDYGGARAETSNGGSGTPPPRIDYPLKNDWMFYRKELIPNQPDAIAARKKAYFEIAKQVINADYWIKDLKLWGTQLIEKTAEGDSFGITDAKKSTAARINIHLFTQLHYDSQTSLSEIDTDEEWID